MAVMPQPRSPGRHESQPCPASAYARTLATRKQAEPIMSGVHTRTLTWWALNALLSASKVLTLKRIVPASWITEASHPISVGRHVTGRSGRRSSRGLAACPAFAAWKYCRYPALVKKIEPMKNVQAIHSAELPSAASAGTRNSTEPTAKSAPIHHPSRSGRNQTPVRSGPALCRSGPFRARRDPRSSIPRRRARGARCSR